MRRPSGNFGGGGGRFAASWGGSSVRLGEDGQEAYPRAPSELSPAAASLIPAAPAAHTRWFPARRFLEVVPEEGPGGSASAAKRPQGTEGGSERVRARASAGRGPTGTPRRRVGKMTPLSSRHASGWGRPGKTCGPTGRAQDGRDTRRELTLLQP